MNEVNYLLLYKGDSDKGCPEASVRSFVKLDAAIKAMHDAHRELAAALGIPFDPRTSSGPYTVWKKTVSVLTGTVTIFYGKSSRPFQRTLCLTLFLRSPVERCFG